MAKKIGVVSVIGLTLGFVLTSCFSTPSAKNDADYKQISLIDLTEGIQKNTIEKSDRFKVEAKVKTRVVRVAQTESVELSLIPPYDSWGNGFDVSSWSLSTEKRDELIQIAKEEKIIFCFLRVKKGMLGYSTDIERFEGKSEVKIVYREIPLSQLQNEMKAVKEDGHGFIVKAYCYESGYGRLSIGNTPVIIKTITTGRFEQQRAEHQDAIIVGFEKNKDGTEKFPQLNSRIDLQKQYPIYIAMRRNSQGFFGSIDRIDDLMSIAEMEKKQASEKAAQEKALAEANRYDPSKFAIVPSDFKPAEYPAKDLFTAVSIVEKMQPTYDTRPDLFGFLSEKFVSDVVFVSQNGTDITFKTADNAISQRMKVDSRTGLSAGQRVRVYYKVSKNPLTEWRVIAIERL